MFDESILRKLLESFESTIQRRTNKTHEIIEDVQASARYLRWN